eukprot:Opistho-1_new@44795
MVYTTQQRPVSPTDRAITTGRERVSERRALDLGRRRHRVEAAAALAEDDAVVTLLAPRRTPAVLDDPVRLAAVSGLLVIADEEDTVVKVLGVAEDRPGVRDTAEVELHGTGVDANRDGAVGGEPGSELCLVRGERLPARNRGGNVRRLERARALRALVGVVSLGHDTTLLLDKLVGVAGEAAVAALVDRVAVNNVLLRERDELALLQEPLALEVACRAEGPARAALALVLDLRDGTLVAPVKRRGGIANGVRLDLLAREVLVGSELVPRHGRDIAGLELLLREVGKLGHAIVLRALEGVVNGSAGEVADEHTEAVGVLLGRLVRPHVLCVDT